LQLIVDFSAVFVKVKDFPLFVHSRQSLRDYCVNADSPILRVTRAGETLFGALPGDNWTVFIGNHSTYVPLSYAKLSLSAEAEQRAAEVNDAMADDTLHHVAADTIFFPVIEDRGQFDGVRRVLFGSGLDFWLHRLLFIDTLSYLSRGELSQPLDRYVLIDIDDIFVGQPGTRMTANDVKVGLCGCLNGVFFNAQWHSIVM
jgi:heparan sulfate N-deacetylase/N-sulfotransferase NDST2